MDWSIPDSTLYEVEKGDQGLAPWAIQRGMNTILPGPLVEDGDYGPMTKAAVRDLQRRSDLVDDGVFGAKTSGAFARRLQRKVDEGLPRLLLRSIVEGESGAILGAVNWSVPGGVDCGYTQRRVYEGDYGNEKVAKRAFNGTRQFKLLRNTLISRYSVFRARAEVRLRLPADSEEEAWRLAVLNHNYPYAADKISRLGTEGLTPYWRTAQNWVLSTGARFDNGDYVETPLNWCRWYSLGASRRDHPGHMVRLVTDWTVRSPSEVATVRSTARLA